MENENITAEERANKLEKLREFELTVVDRDIASAYRSFGLLNYRGDAPLFIQFLRYLGRLVSVLESQVKVEAANNSQSEGSNYDGTS